MRELKLLFLAEKNVHSTEILHSIVIHESTCIETSSDQEIHYLFQLLFFFFILFFFLVRGVRGIILLARGEINFTM